MLGYYQLTSVFHFIALRFELCCVVAEKVEFMSYKIEKVGESRRACVRGSSRWSCTGRASCSTRRACRRWATGRASYWASRMRSSLCCCSCLRRTGATWARRRWARRRWARGRWARRRWARRRTLGPTQGYDRTVIVHDCTADAMGAGTFEDRMLLLRGSRFDVRCTKRMVGEACSRVEQQARRPSGDWKSSSEGVV